jgi:hypothetical protein
VSALWILPLSLGAVSAGLLAVAAQRVRSEAAAVVRAAVEVKAASDRNRRGAP